ncbi:hypothetical protein A3K48_04015 [candidate division WOR-1 bacterium RIFOXYA12_FULL_52_29]|uniref:Uncharacterized protein n=1 Tax=candidate division WOR-1 bacterium RIFOXYC12_FULL_54_18 TaxID=1802584 RepID=A0A1F4T6D7_UNCSA|nr:MAG: hypothetical protein A3K44_04015 [candidate division WOR-1 bacterium RIFOXYA2_FULL_51_19]OGC17720.1 MAG: hypothetical protein A3K48_04015 [candidate division WOR-1 bacterium RIFOXYA12_FULL_52_29]OGC26577.1 MAG: hypothetical protein A3K32_04010 [candidate division WOR-1 bacterium RIFOXYB2_FULL_45_9]OGC28137.1 MAG: hypothetical protein A3K49_04015 [candidate division WOR-1 bacterium RIFOXYC12_FULL_54_18]
MRRRPASSFIVKQESIFRRTTADDLVSSLVGASVVFILAALIFTLTSEWLIDFTLRAVPLDYQQLAALPLRTAYLLFFILGAIVPALLAFFVRTYRRELVDGEVRSLRRSCLVYFTGALAASALLIYKGIAYVVFFGSDPIFPMEGMNERLFFGSQFLEKFLFGLADLFLAAGLIWALALIWRVSRR